MSRPRGLVAPESGAISFILIRVLRRRQTIQGNLCGLFLVVVVNRHITQAKAAFTLRTIDEKIFFFALRALL
jgi:hypothetical protein